MKARALLTTAAIVDIAVGVFLCVVAARSIQQPSFQNVVLGVIEFLAGVAVAAAAVIKSGRVKCVGGCGVPGGEARRGVASKGCAEGGRSALDASLCALRRAQPAGSSATRALRCSQRSVRRTNTAHAHLDVCVCAFALTVARAHVLPSSLYAHSHAHTHNTRTNAHTRARFSIHALTHAPNSITPSRRTHTTPPTQPLLPRPVHFLRQGAGACARGVGAREERERALRLLSPPPPTPP